MGLQYQRVSVGPKTVRERGQQAVGELQSRESGRDVTDGAQVVAVHREAQLRRWLAGTYKPTPGQAADARGTHDVHPRKAVPAPEDQLCIGVEEGITEAFVGGESDFEERWWAQCGKNEDYGKRRLRET